MSDLNIASDLETVAETVGAPSLDASETANAVAETDGAPSLDASESEFDPTGIESKPIDRSRADEAKETIKPLPFAMIRADFDRNPRKAKAYRPENINSLARSIDKYGLQDAIVVSKRGDGSYWIMKGHRRYHALALIHTGIPAIVNAKGKELEPAIPANPDKFKMVKCRVFSGMSYQDELDMVMDHAEVVGLDPQEKYLTADILTRNGFTHEFVAAKLGISRSNYSNFLGRLVAMPDFIADAYMADPDATDSPKPPTQELLKKLYPIYQKEQKMPGARIKQAGPELIRAWEEFQAGEKPPAEKMMPRAALVTIAGTKMRQEIRNVLEAIVKNAPADLSNAIAELDRILGSVD